MTVGDLPPAATTNLLISFIVNQLPPAVTEIVIRAIGVGGELSDGTILPVCSASAMVKLGPEPAPPAPTPTNPPDRPTQTPPPPTPAPTNPPDRPTLTPLPLTPTTSPILIDTPTAMATIFPAILPETGASELKYEGRAFIGEFLLLVLVSSLAVMYFLDKDNA